MEHEDLCFEGHQWQLAEQSVWRLSHYLGWPRGQEPDAEEIYFNVPDYYLELPAFVTLHRVAPATEPSMWHDEMACVQRFIRSPSVKNEIGFIYLLVQRKLARFFEPLYIMGVKCVAELFRAVDRGYIASIMKRLRLVHLHEDSEEYVRFVELLAVLRWCYSMVRSVESEPPP